MRECCLISYRYISKIYCLTSFSFFISQFTLLRQTEDWRTRLDNEELVTVISSDLSKAFDCMCTTRVGASLHKFEGVWSSQHVLLRNYLSGRSQSSSRRQVFFLAVGYKRGTSGIRPWTPFLECVHE